MVVVLIVVGFPVLVAGVTRGNHEVATIGGQDAPRPEHAFGAPRAAWGAIVVARRYRAVTGE